MNYYFLEDELLYQIKMSPLHPKCNLTHQYYSKILFPFLQRRRLVDVWVEFLNYPKEQQLFENAATILAQWYQPQKRICNFDIEASLDDIAQQTLNSLKKVHSDHPIFSTSAEQFSFWKYNKIDYSQWSRIEGKQIIDVLRTVLFDKLGFHLPNFHNLPKFEDNFIDCVLESKIGNVVTLGIIFQSVARRLGVRCDLVRLDLDFLYWKPKFIAENPEDEECFCINLYSGETIQCRRFIESYSQDTEVCLARMVLFMEVQRGTLVDQIWTLQGFSLLECIAKYNLRMVKNLNRKFFNDKMSMSYISFLYTSVSALRRIPSNDREIVEASYRTKDILRTFEMGVQRMNANLRISRNCIVPKNRTRSMKYAVGMIVTCIKSYPNRTGVIIGWDEKYNCHTEHKCWARSSVFVPRLYSNLWEPFYIILSKDGVYYAAQEDLILTEINTLMEESSRWIDHSEIGRYFCGFRYIYYVPNEELTRHYPYDHAFILNKIYTCAREAVELRALYRSVA